MALPTRSELRLDLPAGHPNSVHPRAEDQPLMPTADERYVLRDDAPADGPDVHRDYIDQGRHFGVWDKREKRYAMLPNATLLWGLEYDLALDGLNEMRGRYRAETLRDD